MNITVQHNENGLFIKPDGRLDSATSGELEKVLRNEITSQTASLSVDLTEVDFISSMGMRVLVSAYRSLNGKPIILTGANSSVKEILRLSGMTKIFQII